MLLEAIAAKEIANKIPWKWILIGVAALTFVAGACYAVHSYNTAIREAQDAKQKLTTVQFALDQERAKSARLQQDIADMRAYYAARDTRQQQAATRRTQVLTRKEKTDETGNLAADDATLLDLNRLFPGNPDGNGTADHPITSDLPAAAAGQVRPGG